MNLYIIYGSESLLLKPYINSISNDSICIRIYNNKVPEKRTNFFDFKFDNSFEKNFLDKFNLFSKKIKKIIFIGAASILENDLFMSSEDKIIEKILNTNVKNYIKISKLLIPLMLKLKSGAFIYLSSFRSIKPTKGTILYSSTKSFCETFFKGIGREYGRLNITSHIIRMGAFDGKMLHNLGEEYKKKVNKQISLGREGTPQELSDTIKFCEQNPYTNNGIIEINGGLNIDL